MLNNYRPLSPVLPIVQSPPCRLPDKGEVWAFFGHLWWWRQGRMMKDTSLVSAAACSNMTVPAWSHWVTGYQPCTVTSSLTRADMGLLQWLWGTADQREIMIWEPWQPVSQLWAFYTHKASQEPDSDESPCLVWLISPAPHQTQASTGQILPSWYCLVKAITASCFSDCRAFGCSWWVQQGNACGHILYTWIVSIQFSPLRFPLPQRNKCEQDSRWL